MSPGIVNILGISSHTHPPNNQPSLDTLKLIAHLNILVKPLLSPSKNLKTPKYHSFFDRKTHFTRSNSAKLFTPQIINELASFIATSYPQ